MNNKIYIITAAGGNGTTIKVIDRPLSREEYAVQGKLLGKETESLGSEQAGFLIPSLNHFEMAGGEFCGNASRSAALLLSKLQEDGGRVSFTVSGYDGTVGGLVEKNGATHFVVSCVFPRMSIDVRPTKLASGEEVTVVDLGGIVHVVMRKPFPHDAETYQKQHRSIVRELGLENRGAVGVIWITGTESAITMHPVVWVKDVDTFFYEKSCGSGTIAVAKITGTSSIIQPTGEMIVALITPESVTLKSKMEVTHEWN
ncbi:MAG: hypothetical protein KGH56_00060 [Patescibacteria group bacterium]|nr:hypothetical protein [Patescibacteria group bacterium]